MMIYDSYNFETWTQNSMFHVEDSDIWSAIGVQP
jgi:hypothetical protein